MGEHEPGVYEGRGGGQLDQSARKQSETATMGAPIHGPHGFVAKANARPLPFRRGPRSIPSQVRGGFRGSLVNSRRLHPVV